MPTLACIQESFKIQPSRLIKLVELHLAGSVYYYCDVEDSNISWNGNTYLRNQMAMARMVSQNIEGDFGSQTLTIQNVDQALGEIVRANEVRGDEVVVRKVFQALLANPADAFDPLRYVIADALYDDMVVRFNIETLFGENRNDVPNCVRDRNVCGWRDFDADGSDALASECCGFFTLYKNLGGTLDTVNYPAASLTTCDKGLRTPNGCYAHFNQQDALKPPIRARMYPGIPLVPIQNIQ